MIIGLRISEPVRLHLGTDLIASFAKESNLYTQTSRNVKDFKAVGMVE